MTTRINSVLVLGLGKVGHLVARLLHETGFAVTGADLHAAPTGPFQVCGLDVTSEAELAKALGAHDAVISCLPYRFKIGVARIAAQCTTHYFDLTEDVGTTRALRELSTKTPVVMAPQCGLAPGFIGIVGASLAEKFDRIRAIKLRVGALPQHPSGL